MNSARKLIRGLALSAGLAVVGPAAASAATYYVSPSGSDSNSGLGAATPWRTLDKVNATTLSPGDQVLFEGGQTFSGELDPNGSGTAVSSTTYGSYGSGQAIISGHPATYPTGVSYVTYQNLILDGSGAGDCVDTYSGSAATHITFDNVEIRNCVFGINQSRASDAYWTVQNSYVHNTSDSGIVITGPSHSPNAGHFIIRNNRIEDTGNGTESPPAGANAHGIYDDSPGSQIINNDIGNFQTDGVSLRYRNATVVGNSIHDGMRATCCAAGIGYYNYDATETPGGGTSAIGFNRIWNVPYGIVLSGEANNGGAPGPENWLIYNNTISGSAARSDSLRNLVSYDAATRGTQLTIVNNVFLGNSAGQLYLGRKPAVYREDYNDWAATGGGGGSGRHDIARDPNLAPPPSFAPASGSPLITAVTANAGLGRVGASCDAVKTSYCVTGPMIGAVQTQGTAVPRFAATRRVSRAQALRSSHRAHRHGGKAARRRAGHSVGHATHRHSPRRARRHTRRAHQKHRRT